MLLQSTRTKLLLGFLLAGSLVSATQAQGVVNLGTSAGTILIDGDHVAYTVFELQQDNTDLNGDSDTADQVLFVRNLVTGDVVNTGLATDPLFLIFEHGLVAFRVGEVHQGNQDLNGDSDTEDAVIHLWDIEAGSAHNTGLAGVATGIGTDLVSLAVLENLQEKDLNDDGDMGDFVLHTLERATGVVTNRELAAVGVVSGSRLAAVVSEDLQDATDLNGDNDTVDLILYVYDPAEDAFESLGITVAPASVSIEGDLLAFAVPESQGGADLNGDSDTLDDVAHIHDLATGDTVNTELAALGARALDGRHALLHVSETQQGGTNLNGDGDTIDSVSHLFSFDQEEALNLGVAGASALENGRVAYLVNEQWEAGVDLNGDTDLGDNVYRTALVLGTTLLDVRNVGLAGSAGPNNTFLGGLNGRFLVTGVSEGASGGQDLNNDGDLGDVVLHIFDASSNFCPDTGGSVQNLELAIPDGDAVIALDGHRAAFAVSEFKQDEMDLNNDSDDLDTVLHAWGESCPCIDCVPLTFTLAGESVSAGAVPGPDVYEVKIECTDAATGELLDDTGLLYTFEYRFQNFPSTDDDACESPQVPSWTTVCAGPQESSTAIINFLPGSVLPAWTVTDTTACNRSWQGTTGECVPPPPLTPTFFVSGSPVETTDLIGSGVPSLASIAITSGAALDGSSAPALNDGSIYGGGTISDVAGLSGFVPEAGTTLVVELDTNLNSSGYDLTSTTVLSADEADRPQSFEFAVRQVGRAQWVTLQSVTQNAGLAFCGVGPTAMPGPGEKELTLSIEAGAGAGAIATQVEALRFKFQESTAYREIDVVGEPSPPEWFSRGDCNGDGELDISDAICALGWLFTGDDAPGCVAALNTNGDEGVDLSDAISLLAFLFQGGFAPVAPFPDCGLGELAADTALGCVDAPACP